MSAHLEITMREDRLDCAAILTSEAELDDFVRRLYCAAEGIWPTPAEAGSAQPENSSELENAGEDVSAIAVERATAPLAATDAGGDTAIAPPPAECVADSYELTGLQTRLLDLLRDMPGKPLRVYGDRLGVTEASICTARKRLRELGLIDQAGAVR